MTLDNGNTEVLSQIAPKNNGDFATFEDSDGKGGWAVLDGIADLAAVDESKLKIGMRRYVREDEKEYALANDDPVTWVELPAGGGAVDSVNAQTGIVILDAEDVGAEPEGAVDAGIAAHVLEDDPHPTYTKESEVDAIVDEAIQAHEAALDPHPGYTTDSEAFSIAEDVVFEHTTDSDPHPVYTKEAEVAAIANAAIAQIVGGKNVAVSGTSPALTVAYSPTSLILGATVTVSVTSPTVSGSLNPTGWNDAEPAKAVFIDVNATCLAIVPGLTGGVEGRLAVIRATGVMPVMLTDEDSRSSASGDRFSGLFPHIIAPGAQRAFVYRGTRWVPLSRSDLQDQFEIFDDFIGVTNIAGSTFVSTHFSPVTSSGSVAIGTDNAAGVIGGVQLSGASAGQTAAIRAASSGQPIVPGRGFLMCAVRASVTTLNATGQTLMFRCCFGDSEAVANPTDGLGWIYDNESLFWQTYVATTTGGVFNKTASSVVVTAGEMVWLGVAVATNNSRCDFFIKTPSGSWIVANSLTSGLPVASELFVPDAVFQKVSGAGSRTAIVDAIGLSGVTAFRRS